MDVSTDQLLARVRSRYEIAGDDERSALEGILAMVPVIISQAAEIERLKEQLERTKKQRDQAIDCGGLDFAGTDIFNLSGMWRGCHEGFPDLYAHLAGRGE